MAPSRGKGKSTAQRTSTGRRSIRSRGNANNDVPDAYQSLLEEVSNDSYEESDRPLKRRKTKKDAEKTKEAPTVSPAEQGVDTSSIASPAFQPPRGNLQTVEESSEDDDSDLEFEDVLPHLASTSIEEPLDDIQDVSVSVQPDSSTKAHSTTPRRKPATLVEKAHRLLVHKLHVLCLLSHCMYVNGRCNNAVVQRHLDSLLSSKTRSYLNPKSGDSQFQRNRSFMEGLEQAMQTFNGEYRVTGGGMLRPHWTVEHEEPRSYEPAPPMDRSDFISAARDLEGTQDTGNQLFCALLRAAGVDARLVCSLQVLPFASVPKAATPKKPAKERIYAMASRPSAPLHDLSDVAVGTSRSIGSVPSVRKRLGQPSFTAEPSPVNRPKPDKKSKPIPKLACPVFWVEAFNEAQQKWVAVDATVTRTINKANKLEPPASYDLNQMSYVVAFEDDGVARDVTKRYAKAYNAKTRRYRVEASEDGTRWMKRAMRIFRRRGGALDRDQVEDAELAQKEAREGMPANVQDFKDHPYYALERHLKRHEVIHPKREAGKVNAGTAAKPKMEAVYRRQDVFVCKSADKWYRLGREIKAGEQPLKYVPARAKRQRSVVDDDDQDTPQTTALYAPYQTQLYVPPPVQRGRIPKNVYGNLDVYVPSMVPAGGIHIRNPLAQQAAKLLKVDYADAVTGFRFQGRHGTAIVEGCVVAKSFEDAVRTVVEGFEEQVVEDASKARSLEALTLWRKFLTGLQIRERVQAYGNQEATDAFPDTEELAEDRDNSVHDAVDANPLISAGRFTLAELTSTDAKLRKRKPRTYDSDDHDETIDDGDDEDEINIDDLGGGFLPTESVMNPTNGSNGGGGFFEDDAASEGPLAADGAGGGFMVEENDASGEFVPDDGNGGGFVKESESGPSSDLGGGFLPDAPEEDELFDEKTDHHQDSVLDSHEANEIAPVADEDRPMVDTAAANNVSVQPTNVDHEELPEQGRATSNVDTAGHVNGRLDEEQIDDEDDKDSILSHDPEDDDLEPDWLESD